MKKLMLAVWMSGLLLCGYSASTIAATLTSIAVTPVSSVINIGQTQQFTAKGTFSNGTTQDLNAGTFQATAGPMTQARPFVTAITLKNNKVLVI